MIDVGKDVPVDTFVKKTIEEDADIVAISALMTTSMMYMEPVIKKLKENFVKAKVVVGGAPINNDFANKIGADGYGKDAVEAVKVSKKLVGV
jgi:5-methyltetrahydrofolate--homocysteine methyltransferase